MRKSVLKLLAIPLALTAVASGQTHSSAASVQLRAVVAPSTKIIAGNPQVSSNDGKVFARTTGEGRVAVTATLPPHAKQSLIRVPVKVVTNARSYLLRVTSVASDVPATIRAAAQSSIDSREHSLDSDRAFAIASNNPVAAAEERYIEVQLSPNNDEQEHEVRFEVQAVPMS